MKIRTIVLLVLILIVGASIYFGFEKTETILNNVLDSDFINGIREEQIDLQGRPVTQTHQIEFSGRRLRQLERDNNFPCEILDRNTIICYQINNTQLTALSNTLPVDDQLSLVSNGIPVKNLEGNIITPQNINHNENTTIDVDLTQHGKFAIGFGTNLFESYDFNFGLWNNTFESGVNDDIYLMNNHLSGNYWTQVANLTQEYEIINMTIDKTEYSGTSINVSVRTFNMTDVYVRDGLFEGLRLYYKMDSQSFEESILDYSGHNKSSSKISYVQEEDFNSSGRWDGAVYFDGGNTVIWAGKKADNDFEDMCNDNNCSFGYWIYKESLSGPTWQTPMARWDFSGQNQFWKMDLKEDTDNYRPNFLISNDGTNGNICVAEGQNDRVPLDTWVFVLGKLNNTGCHIYVGGTLVDSNNKIMAIESAEWDDAENVLIGAQDDGAIILELHDSLLDEIMMWDRQLTDAEVASLNSTPIKDWSAWYSNTTSSFMETDVPAGTYVQFKADMGRDGGENVHLDDITFAYNLTRAGEAVQVDNPPVVLLTAPDDYYTFTEHNVSLNTSFTDDWMLHNATLWTNMTGSWTDNATVDRNGTSNSTNFTVMNVPNGKYVWNVLACDNASQCAFANLNRTFEVSDTCVDVNCYPYLCDTWTNTCYESCNSHSQVNSTSFCNVTGEAETAYADTQDCANKEYLSLTDDEVCTSQSAGYCFTDTIGTLGEFCTDNSNGCVNDGVEYGQSAIICGYGDGNDYHFCTGGENDWSNLIDCLNGDEPHNQNANEWIHSGEYCGHYGAELCDTSEGCKATWPFTYDCGSYIYNQSISSCGTDVSECDTGCGASYDSQTCPSPNTLSADCTTCTPPTEDEPPEVALVSPTDFYESDTNNITFQYQVTDAYGLDNCSLWHNATGTWHMNQTNTTAIIKGVTTSWDVVTFGDGQNMSWNVLCVDNNSQVDWYDSNYTLSIRTDRIPLLKFAIYNDSDTNPPIFWVDESGTANITNDLYVNGTVYAKFVDTFSPVQMRELEISEYIDINDADNLGVNISNPYDNYIRFKGESDLGDLLIGFFEKDPYITSSTGDVIAFGESISFPEDKKIYYSGSYGDDYAVFNASAYSWYVDNSVRAYVYSSGLVGTPNLLAFGGNVTATQDLTAWNSMSLGKLDVPDMDGSVNLSGLYLNTTGWLGKFGTNLLIQSYNGMILDTDGSPIVLQDPAYATGTNFSITNDLIVGDDAFVVGNVLEIQSQSYGGSNSDPQILFEATSVSEILRFDKASSGYGDGSTFEFTDDVAIEGDGFVTDDFFVADDLQIQSAGGLISFQGGTSGAYIQWQNPDLKFIMNKSSDLAVFTDNAFEVRERDSPYDIKFTIDGDTGNVAFAGTLGDDGQSTIGWRIVNRSALGTCTTACGTGCVMGFDKSANGQMEDCSVAGASDDTCLCTA